MIKFTTLPILALLILSAPAISAQSAAPDGPVKCTGAKMMLGLLNKMPEIPADKTDVLTLKMEMFATKIDGSPIDQRFFYRPPSTKGAGKGDIAMIFDDEGKFINLDALIGQSKKGELCREMDGGDKKVQMGMSFQMPFNSNNGSHSLTELVEGLADGTAQMKGIAPGPARMLVPKLRYIIITPANGDGNDDSTIRATLLRGGVVVDDIPARFLGPNRVFSIAALKKAKIDSLSITGGPYQLQAMPNPDKGALSDSPQPAVESGAP
ncbi:MAG: hypothetical protein V3U82_03175 [Robiginitomaculum sp.]